MTRDSSLKQRTLQQFHKVSYTENNYDNTGFYQYLSKNEDPYLTFSCFISFLAWNKIKGNFCKTTGAKHNIVPFGYQLIS